MFGIDNSSLSLAVNLLILSLVVIWLALIYWTWADARRRISDDLLVGTAVVASLFPFIGTVVYTILRPPEFLEDVRERELEMKASELRLRHLTEQSCPRCQHPVDKSYLRCPECQARLKDPCRSCGRPVAASWAVCPYCEARIAAQEPTEGVRSKRARRTRPKRPPASVQRAEAGKQSQPAGGGAPRRLRPSIEAAIRDQAPTGVRRDHPPSRGEQLRAVPIVRRAASVAPRPDR